YPLPFQVQTSLVWQNLPGFPLQATYVATNAQIAPSLGRNLGQCRGAATCTGTFPVNNLFEPNTVFSDRVNQIDLRLVKNMRLGNIRLNAHADIYNLFNGNAATQVNTRFGASWLQPLVIQGGRLFKFGVQIDY